MRLAALAVASLAALIACACGRAPASAEYAWDLPNGFPRPLVPKDNPMTAAKVELGRRLFYDVRLSANRTQSCSSCHHQELAFSDGRAQAVGSTGEAHPRGAMSLVNVAYNSTFAWADMELRTLEQQALVPLFGEEPVELGMAGRQAELLARLRSEPLYVERFAASFPSESPAITIENVAKSLASFVRSIISARSPYDRYYRGGERDAVPASAKRGEALFFSDYIAGCFRCHGSFNFSDATVYEGGGAPTPVFHNTGLYNLAGEFSFPAPNLGVYRQTADPGDVGKFRAPPLRNIAITAPYMHDGSVATLQDVLDHYEAGGRSITTGPHAGRGRDNPNRDENMRPILLTEQNRKDLLAFLESLTDQELLDDPRFTDPW